MITVDPFDLLTAEECAAVVHAGLSSDLRPGHMKDAQGADYVAPNVRQSTISFIRPEALGALSFKIIDRITQLNQACFRADLDGRFQFQFASYDGNRGEFINWHVDDPLWDGNWRGKKVSMVTQLSPADDYDGGVLELRDRPPTRKGAGVTVAFPAFLEHRVTPVTRGMRYSLVTWALGPHWR